MPEILQLEFIEQFGGFASTAAYFLFWGSIFVLVVLVGFATYDRFWGPLNGDFMSGFNRWIERVLNPRIKITVPDWRDPETEDQFVKVTARLIDSKGAWRKLWFRWGGLVPNFDWPTWQVRNRPFDQEWD